MAEITAPQSSLKALIAKGKEQTYLTYAEVNDHLPESISDPDQVEDIIQMINDMGIKVFETAPDADALLLNEENDSGADEVAAAEAAAALAAVENEAGRTTDPVRMYMREMGALVFSYCFLISVKRISASSGSGPTLASSSSSSLRSVSDSSEGSTMPGLTGISSSLVSR